MTSFLSIATSFQIILNIFVWKTFQNFELWLMALKHLSSCSLFHKYFQGFSVFLNKSKTPWSTYPGLPYLSQKRFPATFSWVLFAITPELPPYLMLLCSVFSYLCAMSKSFVFLWYSLVCFFRFPVSHSQSQVPRLWNWSLS